MHFIMNIAIIGAGIVGVAWANLFNNAGYKVIIYDISKDALNNIQDDIRTTTDLTEAVANAQYIQECVPEILNIKRDIFKKLAKLTPYNSILASSTSNIPISKITEFITCKRRCLVAHPVNPPNLIPIVEIVPSSNTSRSIIDSTITLLKSINMKPILIKKEISGFCINRLQYALLAEAMRLVQDGVMDPKDIDIAVKYGLGKRWACMGPFQTINLNAPGGVLDYYDRYYGGIKAILKTEDNMINITRDTMDIIDRSIDKSIDIEKRDILLKSINI